MMQTMRKNMKVILWILVLAFIATIIFSWGMGGFKGSGPKQGIAAVINGHEITTERLEDLYQQRLQSLQEENKETELTEDQIKQARSQVWDDLVRDLLIEQEVRKQGIVATDQEIAFLIQNAPPDFIRNNEYFQTDGQFDMKKYEAFLRNPQAARDLMMIEDNYRKTLPNQKFLNELLSMAAVSEQETWQAFTEENLKGKARYVMFIVDTIKIDTNTVSRKQMEDYYYAHKEEYQVPERRRALYVTFKELPSGSDSLNILHHAEELKQRLDQGEDFATLAKDFSEDVSAKNGGDMGFFGRGQMVTEFEQAAFSAPLNQVVGPFLSQFGYHIIKVTERKTENGEEQVRAGHILLKIQPSPDTREVVRSAADGFAEDAQESDFAATARTYEVKVDTTQWFEKTTFIPGLGRMPGAVNLLFSRPAGQVTGVYNIRDGLVVFKSIEIKTAHIMPLNEVLTGVRYVIMEKMKKDKARERGEQFRRSVTDPSQLSQQASIVGLPLLETTTEFKLNDYLPNIGRDPIFTAAALALNVGELSQPVDGARGCYVIELTAKIYPDSTQYATDRDNLKARLLQAKQNEIYNDWLEGAKKKAKIEDYRWLYYRDY
jgi:parvulin-like peptidyl-prolyl isomerase